MLILLNMPKSLFPPLTTLAAHDMIALSHRRDAIRPFRESPIMPKTKENAQMTENASNAPQLPDAPLSPKMLAIAFNTDAKTIRRFLRNLLDSGNHPGKGNRWAIDPNALELLKSEFDAFTARRAQIISIDMIRSSDSNDA